MLEKRDWTSIEARLVTTQNDEKGYLIMLGHFQDIPTELSLSLKRKSSYKQSKMALKQIDSSDINPFPAIGSFLLNLDVNKVLSTLYKAESEIKGDNSD